MALILSILVLILSAGIGESVPKSVNAADVNVAQKDGCGCGCGCCEDEGDASQTDNGDSCHKRCPFCVSNTCPGFAAVLFTDQMRPLSDEDSPDCAFIARRYVTPFVDGIWQPPWKVSENMA